MDGVRRNCTTQVSVGKPGAELKEMLARLGFQPSPNCKCSSKARAMDLKGVDWCEQNIETIIEWLKEEATARGLPFFAMPARMLVRRAIANARREAQRATKSTA